MKEKHWKLKEETIRLSVNKNWEEARKEWLLYNTYMEADPENYLTCVCGHHPIKEIIELINKNNNNHMIVGNCCIEEIMGENKNKFFNALACGSVNATVIEQGYRDGIINIWEKEFMIGVHRKRNFSHKQEVLYKQIKKRLLDFYIKNRKQVKP